MKEKRNMNYETIAGYEEYCRLLNTSHDWLIAAWKETDPNEKAICKIRFCQYRRKADELNKQICKIKNN